jgi:hypothetical protein
MPSGTRSGSDLTVFAASELLVPGRGVVLRSVGGGTLTINCTLRSFGSGVGGTDSRGTVPFVVPVIICISSSQTLLSGRAWSASMSVSSDTHLFSMFSNFRWELILQSSCYLPVTEVWCSTSERLISAREIYSWRPTAEWAR